MGQANAFIGGRAGVTLTLCCLILSQRPSLSTQHTNTSHHTHHHAGRHNASSRGTGALGNNTFNHTGMQKTEWTERDVASCLLQRGSLETVFPSSPGMPVQVHLNQTSLLKALTTSQNAHRSATNISTFDPQAGSSCRLKVKVRRGSYAKIRFPGLNRSVCGVFTDRSYSLPRTVTAFEKCGGGQTVVSLDKERYSSWYSLQVTLRWKSSSSDGGRKEGDLSLHVTGDLGVVFLSSWQGYLQRQRMTLQGGSRTAPQKWIQLKVPANHNLLLSLDKRRTHNSHHRSFTCGYSDQVRVYTTGNYSSPRSFSCMKDTSAPLLLENGAVYVQFPSYRHASSSQVSWQMVVRVLFSFLPRGSGLKPLGDGGGWNCTVEGWGDMRRHFPCNLRRECEGGEDEEGCPYSGPCGDGLISVGGEDEEGCPYSGPCGDGLISVGGGCYSYFGGQNDSTWADSDKACGEQGGTLASLNTPQEWTGVTQLLRDSPHTVETFLGLRRASPGLPRMYRKSYRWSDGTIAHWVVVSSSRQAGHQDSRRSAMAKAFVFSKQSMGPTWRDYLPLTPLPQDSRRPYLCEVPLPERYFGGKKNNINNSSSSSNISSNSSSSSSHSSADTTAEDSADRGGSSSLPSHPRPQPSITADAAAAAHSNSSLLSSMVVCRRGHMVHKTYACDPQCQIGRDDLRPHPAANQPRSSSPFGGDPSHRHHAATRGLCYGPGPHPPLWQCRCGGRKVAYADLCDGKTDCSDGSDEEFCTYPSCSHFTCATSRRCLPQTSVCDGTQDCVDGSDEEHCDGDTAGDTTPVTVGSNHTVHIDLSGQGYLRPQHSLGKSPCGQTHFQCPSNPALCLPVFLLCNSVPDCPSGEDEGDCHTYTCPGFYRCRRSQTCIHPASLCDGKFQCPEGEDEQGCGVVCPEGCACFHLVYFCRKRFQVDGAGGPALRYLDARGSGMKMSALGQASLAMLYHLVLADCRLRKLGQVSLPNLFHLDLSLNILTSLDPGALQRFPNLHVLSLAFNPLSLSYLSSRSLSEWKRLKVQSLDLSGVYLPVLQDEDLYQLGMTELQILNLSFSGVRQVDQALRKLPDLQTLDLTGCPLTKFPPDIFEGLYKLESVYAENYKLCCSATLPPGFNQFNCHAPSDEISSCQSLLRSNMNRFFLYFYTLLAILGNLGSLVYRFCDRQKRDSSLSCHVFISHLCVSDLLMGVFLMLIGAADYQYRGSYVWKDDAWRHSAMCRAAGFLALLSCEVSALMICLITLDRLLALRFPLNRLRFKTRAVHLACVLVWLAGLTLAGIPLLPTTSHWEFYSQTGVCIPLPVTRMDFHGRTYSFGILIIFNFFLFLIIGPGQVLIYRAVRRHQQASNNSSNSNNNSSNNNNNSGSSENLALASRLFTIAMTDFLCWFPVGCLGLLAASGFPIPGEFNVVTVIFVLPVNSALNPFIYTLGAHMDRQQRRQKKCTCGNVTQVETNVDDTRPVAYISSTLDMA